MSFRLLELSPRESTRRSTLRISIQGPWNSPPFNYGETQFFRSWLIYDPELDVPRRMNRHMILGMLVVLGISASFWAGLGLAIAQVWK